MPSNHTLIDRKVDELRVELETWATDTLKLPAGHRVSVVLAICIEPSPVVNVKVLSGRKGVVVSTCMKESDWAVILALPLTDNQRLIVELFKRGGNHALDQRGMQAKLPEGLDPIWEHPGINVKIQEQGLRYRFKRWPGKDHVAKFQFAITT